MNILFFIETGLGVGALLVDQILSIDKVKNSVYAVASTLEQEKGLINNLTNHNIPVLTLKGLESHSNFCDHVFNLSEYILQKKIDIIHVQTNWELALITVVKYKLKYKKRLKVIFTIHAFRNNEPRKTFLARILIGTALFFLSDKVICTSSYLKKNFSFISRKISLLYLGVSNSYFDCSFNPIEGSLQMIFPAQFREGKNQNILIEAFGDYVKKTNDKKSNLYLPGGGKYLEEMKLLAISKGVEHQIIFPGLCTKEEVKALYQKCNIGLISSNSETFGQCIAEPYVLGKCIITRHVGVADDVIINGINGFFFENQNDLLEIFLKLSSNLPMINTLGYTNYCNRNIFSWESISKQYNLILKSVAD